MKRRPNILIHEGSTGHALKMVHCLAAAGAFRIEVASEQADSASRHSRWVGRFHPLASPANSPEGMDQLKDIIRQREIDVLLPINPGEIACVMEEGSDLRSLVRIPAQPSAKTYHTAGSKEQLSMFLEKHGIPHPRTLLYDSESEDFRASLAMLATPFIAKPICSGGGNGIRRFDDRESLVSFLKADAGRDNPYIVQEFIQGRDYGCGVWCSEGEVLYHTVYKRARWDGNSLEPFRGLVFVDDPAVTAIVKNLMKELRWNGVAQIDLLVDEARGNIFVIEINPRFWATIMGAVRMGINFPEVACRQALGLPMPVVTQRYGGYVTRSGSLRYMKRMLRNQVGEEPFGLRNDGILEALSDPAPVILELGDRISKRLSRTGR